MVSMLDPAPVRREITATLRLAGPVVGAQLAQMSMGFVDTLMVGRLGPEALASVALGNTVFFTLLVVGSGVVRAVEPTVAQAHGASDRSGVEQGVRQGLWLSAVLAVPGIVLLWWAEPFLLAMGQEAGPAGRAAGYLWATSFGLLPALWFMALRSFVEALSRPLPVTLITLGGVAVNVLANWLLMFGAALPGGRSIPAMEVEGTGWATSLVFWMMTGALAFYVLRAAPFRFYRILDRWRWPDPDAFRRLVRLGWPIGVSSGIESGLFLMTTLMMGLLGTAALAAHQIAIQCAAFTFMVPLGIGIAGAVRVGQAAGRGDRHAARRAGAAAIVLAACAMGGAAVLFFTAPRTIVGLYLDLDAPRNTAAAVLAVQLLGVAAVFQIFDGVQVAAAGALRGLKDTRVPMLIALGTYWGVGLAGGYVLGFLLDGGATGLWWGLVGGLVAAAIALSWRFHWQTRRTRFRPLPPKVPEALPEAEAPQVTPVRVGGETSEKMQNEASQQ